MIMTSGKRCKPKRPPTTEAQPIRIASATGCAFSGNLAVNTQIVRPAFIMFAALGTPQLLAQAPAKVQQTPGARRMAIPMMRLISSNLVLGVAGFLIGAAGLLLTQGSAASPPPPHGDTNLVAIAAAQATGAGYALARG
jgi:hypothetical protein